MATGTGTDVAIEASDLTLVRGDLRVAADAIRLSRQTLATIKGNLFWAFAYNVAALPLAETGLLSPIIAWRRDGVQLRLRRLQQPATAHRPAAHTGASRMQTPEGRKAMGTARTRLCMRRSSWRWRTGSVPHTAAGWRCAIRLAG